MANIIIPLWFYEFGSLMYILSSVVAFLVSYFSFRLYRYSKSRKHLFLSAAFAFVTFGLAVLTIGNAVSYLNFVECRPNCRIDPSDVTYLWIRFGNYGYYVASTIGYVLLALSYFKTDFKSKSNSKTRIKGRKLLLSTLLLLPILLPVFLPAPLPPILPAFDITIFIPQQQTFVLFPFINPYFQTFHILSSIMLAYIVLQVLPNYFRTKSRLSLLVLLSFLAILLYHVLMFAVAVSPIYFALAHFSLLAGFGMLLLMLVKVGFDERTKIKDASHR